MQIPGQLYTQFNKQVINLFMKRFQPHILTLFCISLFVLMSVLGWHKLPYGFNYSDEGMYMTDGWRLTSGDRLFPDSAMSATLLYAVFNSLVFKIYPTVSLLEFRQLQYVFAIAAITLLGAAAYRWTRNAWPILLALSIFSFTGFDVLGNNSNFSYYTYPSLFLILHIAFLIFAIQSVNGIFRAACFLLSGTALWAIGFSYLPLSVTMASPLLLGLALKYFGITHRKISSKEIMLLLTPGMVLWLAFIATYNTEYLQAISKTYGYVTEGGNRFSQGQTSSLALQYLFVSATFAALLLGAYRFGAKKAILIAAALSVFMLLIINSNLYWLLAPYRAPKYSPQMFFVALLISISTIIIVPLIS